jgi:hypothetical protein
VVRQTASKYLDEITTLGILQKEKIWTENYYIHKDLFNLLKNIPEIT